MSGGLIGYGLWLGKMKAFRTRKQAIQSCIDRTTDETRLAALSHAKKRVQSEENNQKLVDALTTGFIDGKRSNYN
jgi:hypothetical protein